MDWKFILIGLALVGLSAAVQASYNPYINYGYGRPYYTQFNAPPGIPRVAQVYYGTNVYNYGYSDDYESYSETVIQNPGYCVSCGYGYRYPVTVTVPTVAAYPAPVVYSGTVVYQQPVSVVQSIKNYGYGISAGFKYAFVG